MIRSKYIGRVYDNNWKVLAVEIAGRYGKRNKTKANSYRFFLGRETADGKFDKTICVSHNTMTRIDRGLTTVELIEANKIALIEVNEFRNTPYYSFR